MVHIQTETVRVRHVNKTNLILGRHSRETKESRHLHTEHFFPHLKMRIGEEESARRLTIREKISSEERDDRKSHFKVWAFRGSGANIRSLYVGVESWHSG